jgi:hypothetical protein
VLFFSLIMLYFKFRYSGKKEKETVQAKELLAHDI